MADYIPVRTPVPTGLDEIGIHLGMVRIDGESLYDYQRRLILETREPSGPTQHEFVRSLSRRVGQFDTPLLRVDLARDADGEPLAADPHIEVTSGYFRAYEDYAGGVVEVEINLHDRSNGYFVRDIYNALNASTNFTVEVLDPNYEYRLSKNLRYDNSERHVASEILLTSKQNKLQNGLLRSVYPSARTVFTNEESALADVDEPGDYYVDYTNGVLFSYDTQSSFVSYTYEEFPYTLYHQAVRFYPYRDEDKKYFHKSTLISDSTGGADYVNLSPEGAKIANEVLSVHPLTWGE